MKTQQPLLVPDALRDEQWQSNPDIKLGMISYLGVPIVWPDGDIFGTICVLDKKSNEYSELYRKLLLQWRDVLQADLRSLATLHRELEARETKIRRLVEVDIIGCFTWDLEGQIVEANDAFLHIVGYDREDLASGRLRWTDLTPAEWLDHDVRQAATCPA
jgi:PAS domain-containing protein